MSVAKVKTPNALGRVNFKEETDFLSRFIKQGIGKYPCLSPPRSIDSPVQWLQLPHTFDNQGNGHLDTKIKLIVSVRYKIRGDLI